MWEWLSAPIDVARAHSLPDSVAWHARLMTIAWGFLVPIGVLAARFLKIWPGQLWPDRLDHPGWWHLHRLCQYLAGLLTLIALFLVLGRPGRAGHWDAHHLIGWSAVMLAIVQFAGAWLRGSKGGPTEPAPDGSWHGDHYDMSRRRIAFEYIHKSGGYVALAFSGAAVLTGLWQANAPHWMWLSLLAWWFGCITVFIVLQRGGHAFDTYQAHWGADPIHPGNRRRPIGFGVKRVPPRISSAE
jgi:hypothetical protein